MNGNKSVWEISLKMSMFCIAEILFLWRWISGITCSYCTYWWLLFCILNTWRGRKSLNIVLEQVGSHEAWERRELSKVGAKTDQSSKNPFRNISISPCFLDALLALPSSLDLTTAVKNRTLRVPLRYSVTKFIEQRVLMVEKVRSSFWNGVLCKFGETYCSVDVPQRCSGLATRSIKQAEVFTSMWKK